MNTHAITVRPVSDAVIPDIVDLILAQEFRQFTADSRLRAVRSRQQIEAALVRGRQEGDNPSSRSIYADMCAGTSRLPCGRLRRRVCSVPFSQHGMVWR